MKATLHGFALAFLLSGCAGGGASYSADITPERPHNPANAFVVMEVRVVNDSREPRPTVTWQNVSVTEGERTFRTGGRDAGLHAYSVRPGFYRLFVSNISSQYFWEGRTDRYITFEAKPGEAIYVGVIGYALTRTHFAIGVLDEYAQALSWAKERYPEQAGKFKRQLAERRQITGLGKPFGGLNTGPCPMTTIYVGTGRPGQLTPVVVPSC
jgi:hypothetical protein